MTAASSAPTSASCGPTGHPQGPPGEDRNCMAAWLATSEKEGSPERLTPSTGVWGLRNRGRGMEGERER